MLKSIFIVIESIDAAGGSTQAKLLADRLTKEKYHVFPLHFPQEDAPTGQIIYRKFLRNKNKLKFSRREQALLYIQDFFSRAEDIRQHLDRNSPPAGGLARGVGKRAVVSDRFYGSTLAYQTAGLAGQPRRQMIRWLQELCNQGQPALPKPDRIIFLDIPLAISLKHLKSKTNDFHKNHRKQQRFYISYQKIAAEENWTVINCADKTGHQRSIEDIHQDIWLAITN
ncbi:MAG: hypothetical protein COT71_03105 [Candidatus Andersenbacteria bacterium CG10_big_fil_rev_8_21_14_0_10_54_11]|uniref:Thymidylate kinase n=1 Tax=Candidatus Andersenbacteria bacterium CG10_big_fil_rev_8_21_14_0_10_54_11 TaxID=1974485 RepID=A0A2M6WZ07_9BACT|nr:MAG: hypothetical protein COT71_03105 [Candidatus Andersenbacteria bacterium CG10_big_fil_rev_8_21_14_0_10_54_11]